MFDNDTEISLPPGTPPTSMSPDLYLKDPLLNINRKVWRTVVLHPALLVDCNWFILVSSLLLSWMPLMTRWRRTLVWISNGWRRLVFHPKCSKLFKTTRGPGQILYSCPQSTNLFNLNNAAPTMPPLRCISTYLASKRILPLEGAFVRALENGRVSIHTESPFWEGPREFARRAKFPKSRCESSCSRWMHKCALFGLVHSVSGSIYVYFIAKRGV